MKKIVELNFDVQKYILDPNSSILKAGAFKVISKESKIYKLAQNTHLYTVKASFQILTEDNSK